jgi:hypothetical protein
MRDPAGVLGQGVGENVVEMVRVGAYSTFLWKGS